MGVDVFSKDLLAHEIAFGFGFYVADLTLPGGDGIELVPTIPSS